MRLIKTGGSFSLIACFVVIAALLPTSELKAATRPYIEDFDDDGPNVANPSESAPESGTFSSVGFVTNTSVGGPVPFNGGFHYGSNHGISGGSGSTTGISAGASVDFAGSLGGATHNRFVVESNVYAPSVAASINGTGSLHAGLIALSDSPAVANTPTSAYWARVVFRSTDPLYPVGMYITESLTELDAPENGSPGVGDFSRFGSPSVVINSSHVYLMRLQGRYNPDNSLSLFFFLRNQTTGQQTTLSGTDLTPLTGSNFGYRDMVKLGISTSGSSAAIDARFDNFSVIVPEPASGAALLILGAAVIQRRRALPTAKRADG
jgi:hypothetical protein